MMQLKVGILRHTDGVPDSTIVAQVSVDLPDEFKVDDYGRTWSAAVILENQAVVPAALSGHTINVHDDFSVPPPMIDTGDLGEAAKEAIENYNNAMIHQGEPTVPLDE